MGSGCVFFDAINTVTVFVRISIQADSRKHLFSWEFLASCDSFWQCLHFVVGHFTHMFVKRVYLNLRCSANSVFLTFFARTSVFCFVFVVGRRFFARFGVRVHCVRRNLFSGFGFCYFLKKNRGSMSDPAFFFIYIAFPLSQYP